MLDLAVPHHELGEQQARRDAIFIADERPDRIAQRLLVAHDEPAAGLALEVDRRVADPLEASEGLAIVGARGLREIGEQLRGYDRRRDHALVPGLDLEQVVREQRADLITGELTEAGGGGRIGHRDREAIRIGVVREHEARIDPLREREDEIHRALLLGVRERDRREVRIGLALLGHGLDVREAAALQHRLGRARADPLHRRERDHELAFQARMGTQRDRGREVAVVERFVEIDDELGRARVLQRWHLELVAAAELRDLGGDAGVVRRDDLRAVAPVDLVAVVLRRVVTRGDHHARRAAPVHRRP